MFDDLRLAIALRGALRTEDRRVYEQELQEWELAPGFCSALLRLYASPPAQFGVPERLLAVLCLKNAVARRWQHRGVDEGSGGLADTGLCPTCCWVFYGFYCFLFGFYDFFIYFILFL